MNSTQFNDWFGHSLVTVNGLPGGAPLVVYHGTTADFDAFELGKAGSASDSGMMGTGFYFATNKAQASHYARKEGGNVRPVFLSLQKPFVASDYKKFPKVEEPRTLDEMRIADKLYSAKLRELLMADGHDGVIFSRPDGSKELVAFHPEQIKSAIGYSDILAGNQVPQPTGVPTREFKKRVLDNALTYSSKSLVRLDTDGYLAAKFKAKQRVDPVFVVPGNFNRDKFKEVLAEAETAGIKSDRIYVYGDSGSYSGPMITFTRLDSIPGLDDKPIDKTASPAFLKWFGPSLVTENELPGGKPLPVFHGTFADDFSTFRISPEGVFGAGVYFTNLAQSAEGFAGPGDADGARLIPVYLSLKNPMLVKADFDAGEDIDFDSPAVPMVREAMGDAADQAIRSAMAGEGMFGSDLMAAVEAKGHDGVIVTYADGGKDYIAFRPEQIKSAIGNNGDFDAANQDIRFSMPELEEDDVQQDAPGP